MFRCHGREQSYQPRWPILVSKVDHGVLGFGQRASYPRTYVSNISFTLPIHSDLILDSR